MRGNGGGANVHRQAIHGFLEAGPDGHDLLARMHRHGDLPLALAQRFLQLLQHDHIAGQLGQAPFKFERVFQPAQVAAGVVHIGLLHLDIVQAYQRVELHVIGFGLLAHHLLVHLAAGRHVDHHIAQHLG